MDAPTRKLLAAPTSESEDRAEKQWNCEL